MQQSCINKDKKNQYYECCRTITAYLYTIIANKTSQILRYEKNCIDYDSYGNAGQLSGT